MKHRYVITWMKLQTIMAKERGCHEQIYILHDSIHMNGSDKPSSRDAKQICCQGLGGQGITEDAW